MSRDIWNVQEYRAFNDERARAFFELLARIDVEAPSYVVDLGCGPGERTVDLATRWPGALVEGIDSSAQMLAEARLVTHPGGDGELRFTAGDLAAWVPGRPVDVIFSNAALQWVPGHRELLPRWVEALAPGGGLAFGVPANFAEPSHRLLRELVESPQWRERLGHTIRHTIVDEPVEYLDLLSGLGCTVDAWDTTYHLVLRGDDPVLDWMRGTALRPVIDALPEAGEREEFLAELAARLRAAYPARPYGTVFSFRRLFVIAARSET
jgi:trans-aconitate 2-methyltransferase